jgi:hypothetical protein
VRVGDDKRELLAQGADQLGETLRRRGTRVAAEEVLIDDRGFGLVELAGPQRDEGFVRRAEAHACTPPSIHRCR